MAEIYCEAFAARATSLTTADRAPRLWSAFFGLQLALHPASFWVAESADAVVGFALFALPSPMLGGAALSAGAKLAVRIARYGSAARFLARFRPGASASARPPAHFAEMAHLEAIAIAPAWARRGIARAFLEHAQRECAPRTAAMWLRVESDNAAAIRLYERLGMRNEGGTPAERWMVWRWRERAALS